MCWSAKVSLNTYIVAVFGTAFALANGAPLNVIAWFHLFSMMQLAEYFIWTNLHDRYWNGFFSKFGLLILALEPIASMFLMAPGAKRNYIMAAYIAFLFLVLLIYYPWSPYTIQAKNGHLQWMWQGHIHPSVNFIWLTFFLLPLFLSGKYWIAIPGVITVLITLATYWKDQTWGSMWCWIANISWLFVIGFIALNKCIKGDICKKE